jgi:AcrR family transcriptional regulator
MTKDTKRESIILAASEQFKLYGFRKTSMDDISQRLGISRASLYSYFENKDEIFRSVSLSIHERALNRAKNHLSDGSVGNAPALALRVESALLARHSPFQKAVIDSPHGNELFDDYSRLCGDIVMDSHARFQALLASALNASAKGAEVDLKKAGTTGKAAAEILNLGAAGLKHGAPDLTTFKKRLKSFTRIFIAGLK